MPPNLALTTPMAWSARRKNPPPRTKARIGSQGASVASAWGINSRPTTARTTPAAACSA